MRTMPVVNGIEQEYVGRLQVVRLNFNDRQNEEAITALGVRGHPTIVLLDKRGKIFRTRLGEQTDAMLRPHVEALLAEGVPTQ